MFSYTSAISWKWLAIVFRGLKLGNIRNPFGHSSATLSAISYRLKPWDYFLPRRVMVYVSSATMRLAEASRDGTRGMDVWP
jgi:hypothetical protein